MQVIALVTCALIITIIITDDNDRLSPAPENSRNLDLATTDRGTIHVWGFHKAARVWTDSEPQTGIVQQYIQRNGSGR